MIIRMQHRALLVSGIVMVDNDESSSTSMGNMAYKTTGEMETSPHVKELQEDMELSLLTHQYSSGA